MRPLSDLRAVILAPGAFATRAGLRGVRLVVGIKPVSAHCCPRASVGRIAVPGISPGVLAPTVPQMVRPLGRQRRTDPGAPSEESDTLGATLESAHGPTIVEAVVWPETEISPVANR